MCGTCSMHMPIEVNRPKIENRTEFLIRVNSSNVCVSVLPISYALHTWLQS